MTSANLPVGGTVGGKYRLLRLLGEGGMGAVFEAQNELTLKRVAVKVMHPTLAADEQAAARMLREAQTSSRVRHPNVVDVYDAGHDGDTVFLVMEYLEGEPFGDAVKRAGVLVHEAIALLVDAMRGVAAAHRVGVIHRDIKPDNIFLAREGESPRPVPKVLDFGVSKLTDETSLRLTRTDVTIGTPLYMSYEQLSGMREGLDARADVYAFGVILYEILTGRPPHQADTLAQLAMLIATVEPPAPRDLRPEIPRALEAVVQKATAKHREQRTNSLEVLMRELDPFTRTEGFLAPLAVALPLEPGLPPATQPDAIDGQTVELDTEERTSTPAAGTAPSLPVQRSSTKRIIGVGALLGTVLGLATLLPYWSETPPRRVPAPLPAATKSKVEAQPPVTQPTQVAPVDPSPRLYIGADAYVPPSGLEVPDAAAIRSRSGPSAESARPGEARPRREPVAARPPPVARPAPVAAPAPAPEPAVTPPASEPPARRYRAGKVDRSEF